MKKNPIKFRQLRAIGLLRLRLQHLARVQKTMKAKTILLAIASAALFSVQLEAATIGSLSDNFDDDTISATKWAVLEADFEAGAGTYTADTTTNADQLTIAGTNDLTSFWGGKTLQSVDTFSSGIETTVTVTRVSLAGSGSAYRSSMWIWQPGGQYLHFAHNVGENGWQYNPTNTGGGSNIGAFDAQDGDLGTKEMQLIFKPLGGTSADVEIYLDGELGATHNFTNWDNAVDFHVRLSGMARAAPGDTVTAVFDDFLAGNLFDGPDADGDGIPDELEDMHDCLDKDVADADADPDMDGLSNIDELTRKTDPCDDDTDDDNVLDGDEVNRMVGGQPAPTDPRNADTDDDGLNDDVETNTGINNGPDDTGTDPLVADGDGDGLSDGFELNRMVDGQPAPTNPFEADSDDDTWDDGVEVSLGTDPNDATSFPNIDATTIVDVDATNLELDDAEVVDTLANLGLAGPFSTVIGSVETVSHASNNDPSVLIQGLAFEGDKMVSAVSQTDVGITGNQVHSISAWVWNPDIAAEEAIVSWGHRGGPDGSNLGFHQGTNASFGAVGHWGGPDVGYGNDGTDINDTLGRWANLGLTFDGNETKVFIDGALSNTKAHGALAPHETFNDNVTPLPLAIGSEHNGDNVNSNPIPFSGTIARVQVFNVVRSNEEILEAFEAESPFFFDGIPDSPDNGFRITGVIHDPDTEFVSVTWTSRPRRFYTIQSSVDLTEWDELDDSVAGAEGETTTYVDSMDNPPGTPQRFYRVLENP